MLEIRNNVPQVGILILNNFAVIDFFKFLFLAKPFLNYFVSNISCRYGIYPLFSHCEDLFRITFIVKVVSALGL